MIRESALPVVNLGHPDDHSTEDGEAALWLKLGGTGIDTAYDYVSRPLNMRPAHSSSSSPPGESCGEISSVMKG